MGNMLQEKDWWRGAIIYQIYPRSFADSNNDGVGDLRGITEKMPYIASLGVDAIWISPFFKSPMKDFGYDVSDYEAVDPLFGNMADFDALIEVAHKAGVKVIIDQVLSHTSEEHPWFKESRSSRNNPKADWYVWADAKPDGTPPNNWLSIFGGVAWKWDSKRRQYYLHNFLESQPDLNFHNPEVRKAMLGTMEFWLKKGVDGFRFDTLDFYYHDKQLRNNPARERSAAVEGLPDTNPYGFQQHLYDKCQLENLLFVEDMRKLMDTYGNTTSVGEIGSENALDIIADYTKKDTRAHMVYTFNLLGETFSAAHIRKTVEYMESHIGNGWPCWAFSNHDVKRVVSRWGKAGANTQMAKLLVALLTSLRGSYCLYQGEELGLTEADIPYEKLQDPYGITFWPEFKGRDGCRTPMPWQKGAPHGGFSVHEPWLPVPDDHKTMAVDVQEKDKNSVLHFTRQFFAWRKTQPTLQRGDIQFLDAPEPLLAFTRTLEGHSLLVVVNLGAHAATYSLPAIGEAELLAIESFACSLKDNMLQMPAYSAAFATIG